MNAPLASILIQDPQSCTCYGNKSSQLGCEIEKLFRAEALAETSCLLVKDACKDGRFKDHPAVIRYGVRFAAAMAIINISGSRLGTVAVYDFTARQLTAPQKNDLARFASSIAAQLEWAAVSGLEPAIAEQPNQLAQAAYTQDFDGRILNANPAFETATGYSLPSLIGMNCSGLLLPESAVALKQYYISILGGESAHHPIALTFVHKGGHLVRLEFQLKLIYGMGKPTSLLCVARGIANGETITPGEVPALVRESRAR